MPRSKKLCSILFEKASFWLDQTKHSLNAADLQIWYPALKFFYTFQSRNINPVTLDFLELRHKYSPPRLSGAALCIVSTLELLEKTARRTAPKTKACDRHGGRFGTLDASSAPRMGILSVGQYGATRSYTSADLAPSQTPEVLKGQMRELVE